MIQPLGNIVIIRRSSPDQVTASGIFLVFDPDYREDIGEVLYVGNGTRHRCKHCKTSTVVPLTVKVGDVVLFSTNGHQITKINGEELVVLKEPSVIGILSSKEGIESGNYKSDRQYAGVE